jgi:serine/threonine protein kinase
MVLKASGISKEESAAHPQAVLDVLNFHMEGGPPTPLPRKDEVVRDISDAAPIRRENYSLLFSDLKKLGQGASGIVYAATRISSGEKVALKVAPVNELADLTNEMGLQSMCRHENIVEFKEAYVYGNDVCIVMELVLGSSLTNCLGVRVDFPEPCIAYVCREVLKGLQMMHSLHRLHRDIKSDNVLVRLSSPHPLLDLIITPYSSSLGWIRWLSQNSRLWICRESHSRAIQAQLCGGHTLLDGPRAHQRHEL